MLQDRRLDRPQSFLCLVHRVGHRKLVGCLCVHDQPVGVHRGQFHCFCRAAPLNQGSFVAKPSLTPLFDVSSPGSVRIGFVECLRLVIEPAENILSVELGCIGQHHRTAVGQRQFRLAEFDVPFHRGGIIVIDRTGDLLFNPVHLLKDLVANGKFPAFHLSPELSIVDRRGRVGQHDRRLLSLLMHTSF